MSTETGIRAGSRRAQVSNSGLVVFLYDEATAPARIDRPHPPRVTPRGEAQSRPSSGMRAAQCSCSGQRLSSEPGAWSPIDS